MKDHKMDPLTKLALDTLRAYCRMSPGTVRDLDRILARRGFEPTLARGTRRRPKPLTFKTAKVHPWAHGARETQTDAPSHWPTIADTVELHWTASPCDTCRGTGREMFTGDDGALHHLDCHRCYGKGHLPHGPKRPLINLPQATYYLATDRPDHEDTHNLEVVPGHPEWGHMIVPFKGTRTLRERWRAQDHPLYLDRQIMVKTLPVRSKRKDVTKSLKKRGRKVKAILVPWDDGIKAQDMTWAADTRPHVVNQRVE